VFGLDLEKFSSTEKKKPTLTGAVDRTALRKTDLELWHQWNGNGRKPDDLRPLLNNFRGMIRKEASRYERNVEIPPAAIHHEFKQQFVRAMQTYDPNRGAALGTWVTHNLQKGQRWVNQHQNIARIAEPRSGKVGDFKNAVTYLTDQFGREPAVHEISEHLGWAPKEIDRMQKELRKSHVASAWEVDPVDVMPSKEKERLLMLRLSGELSPEETLVFDYTIGHGGKPQLKPSQIARTLSMNPSKVTRIRQKIADKITKFME
jgi:DNA-directed RNA polymerase specialized sigma subunit